MEYSKKIIEKYKSRLQECADNYDPEVAHSHADDILVEILNELGFQELAEIFCNVRKLYA